MRRTFRGNPADNRYGSRAKELGVIPDPCNAANRMTALELSILGASPRIVDPRGAHVVVRPGPAKRPESSYFTYTSYPAQIRSQGFGLKPFKQKNLLLFAHRFSRCTFQRRNSFSR